MKTPIDLSEITERLNSFVKSKGWSKKKFAEEVGIQPQNVSKYLSGELETTNLYNRLYVLGCDINWLISGTKSEGGNNNNYYSDKHIAISNMLNFRCKSQVNLILDRLWQIRTDPVLFRSPDFDNIPLEYAEGVEQGTIALSIEYLLFFSECFDVNLLFILTGDNEFNSHRDLIEQIKSYRKTREDCAKLKSDLMNAKSQLEYADSLLKSFLAGKVQKEVASC